VQVHIHLQHSLVSVKLLVVSSFRFIYCVLLYSALSLSVPFYEAWDLFRFDRIDVSLILPQFPKFIAMVCFTDCFHLLSDVLNCAVLHCTVLFDPVSISPLLPRDITAKTI
jgi:hypothetical protein